jgi:riboflavin synthase
MFTGIIKAKGEVLAITPTGGDARLVVRCDGLPFLDYAVGESIAVNGVCLTAVNLRRDGFDADVSNETLNVTALGKLAAGSVVNLEPSLGIGERLGGHLVSGHVDCVGKVIRCSADARSLRLSVEIPEAYSRYVARKGSVCVDGVSLTINEVSGNAFDLNIIPHTATETISGDYGIGTLVNVEVDLLARYVERLLSRGDTRLDEDFLREHGYV